MPLCTLSISYDDFHRAIIKEGDTGKQIKDLCGEVLDLTVKRLGIPDENDIEMLVRLKSLADYSGSDIKVSFTCGDVEYPDYSSDIFDPKKELIQEVCDEIQKIGRSSIFEIKSTKVEAWRGTTFGVISPEDKIEVNSLRSEFDDTVRAETTIVTSVKLDETTTFGPKERGGFYSERVGNKIGNEISGFLPNGAIRYDSAIMADTDIGITVDFPGVKEISGEIRNNIASEVRQSLGRNVEGKSATIWIRPGRPEVYQSMSSN